MNFNLVEMYNGLLRFNKHILNELAEGLKHLPNLDGVSKGDSLIINEQGNPALGSAAFIPTFENAAYGIEWTKDDNDIIRIGNAKFHRELPIQNRLKGCVYAVRVLLLGVALITVLRLALVSFILIGLGQVLLLMSASLLQLNLIK